MIKFLAVSAILVVATALGDELPESAANGHPTLLARTKRAINNERPLIERIPWQVSLGTLSSTNGTVCYKHGCGGSIISNHWVVTAAHCLVYPNKNFRPENLIIAGASDYFIDGSRHIIDRKIAHPDFEFSWRLNASFNDIGLIHVITPFVYGLTRRPVRLNDKDSIDIQRQYGELSGWIGTNSQSNPKILSTFTMPIQKKWQCNRYLKETLGRDMENKGQICGNGNGYSLNAGNVDSGGSLIVNNDLVGIVPWGHRSSFIAGKLTSYTEIAHYRDWIRRTCLV